MLNALRSLSVARFIEFFFKRDGPSEKNKTRYKKKTPILDGPSAPKVKVDKGSGSQNCKPTCVTCEKKQYGNCLVGTRNCFSCGKDEHKARDFPNVSFKAGEVKEDPPYGPDGGALKRNRFYALRAKRTKSDDDEAIKL